MKLKKYFLSTVLFLCSVFAFSDSTKTNIEGLFRKTLDNGLNVFVMENNSAPLAYIEIAVRAGATTQTPETAGLFHLYEHLMFKGNSKYPNQDAFQEAMNKLGVGSENGTTGVDRVNYFFTIPSSVVREGMEFWSYAIRTPKIDKDELEREKGVVISEIKGKLTQPSTISYSALCKNLYSESPYRLDSGGTLDSIQNATVEQMKKIQSEYYVPENAALFIGGDVNHEQIFKYAQEIFGSWKRSSNPVKFQNPPKKNFDKTKKLVFPSSSFSDMFVSAGYYLRGPDGETDKEDTYAADVWANLVSDPENLFSKTFVENPKLSIPDSDYVGAGYLTQRASGRISFSGYMYNDSNPVQKADEFLRVVNEDLINKMLDSSSGFTKDIKTAVQKLEDSRIYELETATGILSNLSFFFTSCDSEYFFNYDKELSKVTENDVYSFLKKYVQNKNGIFIVTVSPRVFEQYKDDFVNDGFTIIDENNAFWWKEN